MISAAEICVPIAGDDPSGEDLSLDTSLIELDSLVLGKPETQFSQAEDPEWNAVQDTCIELFKRSLDLRVALPLALAAMKKDGLGGLKEGITILRMLIETYWDNVHPKLDPEDNNDPLQRMNTLAIIGAPLGTAGDPMRFQQRLREVYLANSRAVGRFSYGQIADAKAGNPPAGFDMAVAEAAFRDMPKEELQQSYTTAGEALEQLKALEAAIATHVDPGSGPNLDQLDAALTDIQGIIAPFIGEDAPAQEGGGDGQENASTGGRISGSISSREDVLRVLGQIRTFYANSEPASPIPLLVRRIERMVPMTFIELMNEMAPDAMNAVNTIVGPQS